MATQAELTQALINLLQTDPNISYGDVVKEAAKYSITPEQVQTTFGTLPESYARTYVPNYTEQQTANINSQLTSTDPIVQAWAKAEQTGDYSQIADMVKNISAPVLQSKYGLTTQDINYIYSRPTVTDPLAEAWINAEKTGNYTGISDLLKGITADQLKATYNLGQNDIDYIASRTGIAGKLPANWSGMPIKQTGTNTITGTPTQQTATVGQFRELFPSFEESKRLAAQTIANRPTTQQIVNMISNPQNPALTSAWQNAEKTGQYGDVANMLKSMPLGKVQSAYGLSNADMQYIMSRPEIATALAGSNTTAAPAPTLTNVLGMISK